MTPLMTLVLALAAALPILALIVFVKLRKRAGREAPKEQRPPFPFLRRFTLPQRTYLHQQFVSARTGFLLCAYFLLVVVGVALLPDQLHLITPAGHPQQVWERFKNQLLMAGYVSDVIAFVTAMTLVTTLQSPAYANFVRTRPLSFCFLFWGRVCFWAVSFLAGTQAAVLISFLLLTLIYGPVWKLAAVPLRSVFPLDLSLLTTTLLIFSLFVCLAFIPRRRWPITGKGRFILTFFAVSTGSQAVPFMRFLGTTSFARVLFLFPAQASSSHYAYALVPLASVAMLLFLAEHLFARFEPSA